MTQLVKTQEKVRRTVGKNLYHFREYQNHHKPIVGRNTHIKSAVDEGSEGSEEHVIRVWSKEDPCYKQK